MCPNYVKICMLNTYFAGLCMEIGNYLLLTAKCFIPKHFSPYASCKCSRIVWTYFPRFYTLDFLNLAIIFLDSRLPTV